MATKSGKVNTATLKRGRTYTQRSKKPINPSDPDNPIYAQKFERDVPVVIETEEFLRALESEMDTLTDGEGEQYEKPRFKIERGVEPPDGAENRPRVTRLSVDRSIKKRKRLLRQMDDE